MHPDLPRRRALLLINDRSSRADTDLGPAIDRLEAGGVDVDCLHPETIEEARMAIMAGVDRDVCCVLVAGGDGTLNRLVDAVLESGLPLVIVPLGTANVLARTLGLPIDPVQACLAAAEGWIRRIDVGRVNGQPFLSVASLGLSERVARESTPARKQQFGPFSYVISTILALRSARSLAFELQLPAETLKVRAIQLDVANSHHLGSRRIEADAEPDDGLLTLSALRAGSPWAIVLELWRFWSRRVRRTGESLIRRAPDVTVRTREPVSIDADGEPVGSTPARFEIAPRALSVLVPGRPRAIMGGAGCSAGGAAGRASVAGSDPGRAAGRSAHGSTTESSAGDLERVDRDA